MNLPDEQELESLVPLSSSDEEGKEHYLELELELSPTNINSASEINMRKNKAKSPLYRLRGASGKKYLTLLLLTFVVIVGVCKLGGKEEDDLSLLSSGGVNLPENSGSSVTSSNTESKSSANKEVEEDGWGEERLFTCPDPDQIQKSENDKDEMLTEFYDEFNINTTTSTISGEVVDVDELKKTVYDGWGHSYNEFRDILYDWKSTYFSSLKSGDTIFESGCGSGLNLLMTVDILKESTNVDNLKVYGIEYVTESVVDANRILGQVLPQTGDAELGSPICRGDATNLFYIPSDSFDLSYTGYIDPIYDPLNLHLKLGREVEWEDFCYRNGHIIHKTADGKLDQEAVENWYAKWVAELVRITKPGKPIVIEQVSLPTCDDKYDWGGVSKSWWHQAIDKYGWDVDGDSIVIEDLNKRSSRRYNIFMEKNHKDSN